MTGCNQINKWMQKCNRYVDLDKSRRHYFLTIIFCIYRNFLFFADVSIQISAVSSTFSATDLKHVLLICFDIFSSMFLILNNI